MKQVQENHQNAFPSRTPLSQPYHVSLADLVYRTPYPTHSRLDARRLALDLAAVVAQGAEELRGGDAAHGVALVDDGRGRGPVALAAAADALDEHADDDEREGAEECEGERDEDHEADGEVST
jgi:hypothetical protein